MKKLTILIIVNIVLAIVDYCIITKVYNMTGQEYEQKGITFVK